MEFAAAWAENEGNPGLETQVFSTMVPLLQSGCPFPHSGLVVFSPETECYVFFPNYIYLHIAEALHPSDANQSLIGKENISYSFYKAASTM